RLYNLKIIIIIFFINIIITNQIMRIYQLYHALFILFLEKFTPVGSIIHRFRRRKFNLKRNIERDDDDRYSLYHRDTMPADSENKRYYIEYARPHN
ncbi:PIR protein, partial [Plasmodium vivax]